MGAAGLDDWGGGIKRAPKKIGALVDEIDERAYFFRGT
jgi:hypothetical protein